MLKNRTGRITKIKLILLTLIISSFFGMVSQAQAETCEAVGAGHCYYIAPNGDDNNSGTFMEPFASTNPIIDNLQPGDFVYFRGGNYGVNNRGQIVDRASWFPNRYSMAYIHNLNGEENNLITFKAYPNELPVIDLYNLNPEFEPTALVDEPRFGFYVAESSYIKIEGFEIIHGAIDVTGNSTYVWVEDNHIHDFWTNRSNNGLIRLASTQNVYLYNNKLHDTYERAIPDGSGLPCNDNDRSGCKFNVDKEPYDPGHNGCITTLSGDIYSGYNHDTSGPFEFVGNDIYDCPTRFFIKNPQGESVDENGLNVLIKDNYIHGSGYLFYSMNFSNALLTNNLCTNNCFITFVGSLEFPNDTSNEEIINEIDARNITIQNNVFLNVNSFMSIRGLGFKLANGVYSTAEEDKLKFKNNLLIMSEATLPENVNWNSHGYVFSNSYNGQNDNVNSSTPSKIFNRIISENNCIANSLGDGIGFVKQFLVNDNNNVNSIVGYTHNEAVNNFGISGVNDTFPTNLTIADYFIDSDNGDYSLKANSPCTQSNLGLTNPVAIQNVINREQSTEIRADVDQNSTINSTDAMLTLRNSLGLNMSGTNWVTGTYTGDVNCDDDSNSTDAMLILRKSLGLDIGGTGWCVDNQVSYGESGTHTVATHTEVDTGDSVIYYPADMSTSNKVPVVFFNPGWQSSDPQDYETLLQFIAGHGYAVIYAKDYYGDTASFISRFEKMLDGNNDILPKLDTTRIGVIGHSSGGGDTFKILEHFSNSGYGNNGRFLMALDPWFAFDMNSEGMRNLPSNINLVILQFGSDGGATDPRIPLSEYALLNSIVDNKKDYQVYTQENADHGYPSGNKPVDQMQGVLKPLDALMDYTFNGTTGAHDIALEVGSDDPVGTGLQTINAIDSYSYRCNSHKNLAEIMDIDYCNQYAGGKQYPVDTIFDEKTIANVAQPNYLASYIGPVFGNKVTRITDRANQTGNAKPYPKTQVWNADMSLIRLGYRIYNANDFSETTTTQNNLIRGSLTEMKWSTWEPNVFYGIDIRSDRFVFVRATIDLNNNIITYEDIVNNDHPEQSAIFLKTDYDELKLGKYEGNLDFQDNYVVFAGRKKDTNELTLIVYHLQDNYGTQYNEITAQHDFADIKWYAEDGNGNFDPNDGSYANQVFDWASISALGNYVIVNYKSKPGDAEQEYSIEQYDRQLNHIRRLADHGDHGDLGIDANGKEVYVQFGFGSLNGESNIGIWMYPLDGSPRVRLLPDKYNGGHISCRNYQRPGWCYANTRYVWNGAGMREAFAIKLDDSGTVERFAQTHNTTANGGLVQVNPSPDGTQVLFNSDWGDVNNVIDTYNVQLP